MNKTERLSILKSTLGLIQSGFCTSSYAKSDGGHPVGLNSTTATRRDLAGALWCSISLDTDNPEGLFHELWAEIRVACGWSATPHQGEEDRLFCRYLDSKSQAWHISVLDALIHNRPVRREPKRLAKALALLETLMEDVE